MSRSPYPEISQDLKLSILNFTGQEFIQQKVIDKKTVIDLKNLPSGVYIIKAKTDKEIVTNKFIKQ